MHLISHLRLKTLSVALTTALMLSNFSMPTFAADALPACTITVSDSNMTLTGTPDADVICVTGNENIINAFGGDDIVIDDGENNVINLGDGSDQYFGVGGLDETVNGGPGDDTLYGGSGSDELYGGEGDDITVGGYGDDLIDGGTGSDWLDGDAGADDIYGEAGTDTLVGGPGNDILVGGAGTDSHDGGADLNICDYESSEPLVDTCTYDDDAPVVSEFKFTPTILDTSSSSRLLSYHLEVTDALGVRSAYIDCGPVEIFLWGGNNDRPSVVGRFDENEYEGNVHSDSRRLVADGSIPIPEGYKPGTYPCQLIDSRDIVGNSISGGLISGINIMMSRSGVHGDSDAPVAKSSLSATSVDVTIAEAKIDVGLQASDAKGVKSASVSCSSNKGSFSVQISFDYSGVLTEAKSYVNSNPASALSFAGNSKSFNAKFRVTLPIGYAPGQYECQLQVSDVVGNSESSNIGFVTVNRSGDAFDSQPPVIGLAFDKDIVEVGTSSGAVRATLTATDASGVLFGQIDCETVNPSNSFSISFGGNVNGVSGWSNVNSFTVFTAKVLGDWKNFSMTVDLVLPMGFQPGLYTCSESSLGDSLSNQSSRRNIASFKVFRTPAGLPKEPTDLVATLNGNTGVILSWGKPSNLGSPALNDYVIEFSNDLMTWKRLSDGKSSNESLSLSRLRAKTNYWFRVRGENGGTVNQDENFMSLNWSMNTHVLTGDPAAPDAVTGLGVEKVLSNEATMAWTYTGYDGGDSISTFKVETSRDGVTWKEVPHNKSTSLKFALRGLAPGTTYRVRVSAVNSVGASAASSTVFKTKTTTPSAPTALSITKRANTSGVLSWSIPASNGGLAITDYKVEFVRSGKSTWKAIAHKPSRSNKFVLTGLTKNVYYKFRVTAINANGAGAVSKILTVAIR